MATSEDKKNTTLDNPKIDALDGQQMATLQDQKKWCEKTLKDLEKFQHSCEEIAANIDKTMENAKYSLFQECYNPIKLNFEDFKKATRDLYFNIVRVNKPYLKDQISALNDAIGNEIKTEADV